MNISLRACILLACFIMPGVAARAQVASFTASPTSGCAPLIVNFTNTSSGNISTHRWVFGNSGTSSFVNPSTTYTAPGTYTVQLTVSGPGGSDVETKTAYITVYPPPVVSFTHNNASGCAPHTVQFASTVTPGVAGTVTYYWDFGDGNHASTPNPSHSYTTAGTYSVSVTAINSKGCSTIVTLPNTVTVYPKPVASFVTPYTLKCSLPAVVPFTSSVSSGTGPFNIVWNFGDGSPGTTGNNPTHTYTTSGTYTVSMSVTDARGCKDTLIQAGYVQTFPSVASFTGPSNACDSALVSFTNTSPGVASTEWDFGDGNGAIALVGTHKYTMPGTYTVKMFTNLGNGCADTAIKTITIHPKPVVSISHDIPCPPPSTMQFSATSSVPATYQWAWASGGTATGTSVGHSYTGPGIDSVTVIATTSAGCSDTLRMDTVYVRDIVIMDLTLDHDSCAPFTVTFAPFVGTSVPCVRNMVGIYPHCPYPYAVTSWHWVVDGTTTYNTQYPTHTFTTVGGHVAMLTITTANGCTYTQPFYFATGQKVPPSFTVSPRVGCVTDTVYFTNTTPDTGIKYTWKTGEVPDGGQYHHKHRYRVPGTYNIMLISDYNGCYDTLIKPLHVTINPSNALFRDSIYCSPHGKTVQFIDTSIGATTHLWEFGDGNTSTLASPLHTYVNYGTYFPRHITWNSTYGCRDTVVDSIHLALNVISLAAHDSTLCLGDTLKLQGAFSGLQPDPYDTTKYPNNFYWEINNYHKKWHYWDRYYMDTLMNSKGFHTILFSISTRDGRCVDSIRKQVIESRPVPDLSVSSVLGCTPMSVTFSDASVFTPGTQSGNRFWVFGNGDTASNNNSSSNYTYTQPGVYSIKLRVTDWNGCADSIYKTNYIEARHPTADFMANTQNGCIGVPVNFTNLSYGATRLSYKWSFGDGDTAISLGPSHAYRAVGSYTVRLIVTDSSGCSDTLTRPAHINVTRPTAAFTLSDSIAICPPLTVTFTSTSTGAASHAWAFGNGGTATIPVPVSTYTSPGIYPVRLIVFDAAGCPDTAIHSVRVLGYAGAFSYDAVSGCAPLTVNFTANITNVPSLVWDFSDGATLPATGATATHTYLTPGAYLPKLIFSDNAGCTASSDGGDTIYVDAVIAGFKAVPPCEKSTMQFFDTSYSYFTPINNSRWEFGSSGVVLGNPVSRIYPNAGTYPVTLVSTNANGCKDTLSRDVIIHPLPKVVAIDDTAVCIPDAIVLSAAGAKTYAWTPPSYLSCTACATPSASPTAPTVYVVTGTDSNGCVAKDTVRVGIQTKSTFTTSGHGEICLGQYYQLVARGATLYNWTPAATLDSPGIATPRAKPTVNTTYIVTGREGSCLADTHSVRVTVRPLPAVDAGSDLKVVAGNAVLLQASGNGIKNVSWTDDPTLSCFTCYAPEARPKVSTTYYLTAYNEFNCAARDSVRVFVLCDGSQLFIPNSFTPNADGINDFFFPRGQGIDMIRSFRVYSRWGELLFDRKGIAINDEFNGWNGTFNSQKLNPDVYVYIIEATCDTGEPILFKGDITLIR